jgi:cholesterol oxidase
MKKRSLAVGDRLAFAFLPDGVSEAMSDLHFDAIVIGSGFGGSVAAYRLSEAGKSVCLLERGKPYPPGSFARSPRNLANNVWEPSTGRHGLFNIWSFNKLESIVSSGLGGGSLIYANVLLRKDEHWFRQKRPDGNGDESWPITRKDLDPHYTEVERMMNVQKFPFGKPGYEDVTKTQAMKDAADIMGLIWDLPNLAITFANQGKDPVPSEQIVQGPIPNIHGRPRKTWRLCGECDLGCNDGSKNTLDHTYLSAAAVHGTDIRTRSEVRHISPMAGGYEVAYVEHLPENEGRATATQRLQLKRLTAKKVSVAAGTYGSTYLLLKNTDTLTGLGPALGTRFSGNGDVLAFALNATRGGVPRWLKPSSGPVITSYIRTPDFFDSPPGKNHGHYVEDADYPAFAEWLVEASQVPGLLSRAKHFLWRAISRALGLSSATDISSEVGCLVGQGRLSASSLPMLGMGRDTPDGVLSLNGNNLATTFKTHGPSRMAEAKGLAAFGALIMGELRDTYGQSVIYGSGKPGDT